MPCHAAMIANPPTVTETQSIEDVLSVMHKNGLEYIPVLDEKKQIAGVFSYVSLLKSVLPVSVHVQGGGVVSGAAPGMAKRLKNMALKPVADVMDKKANIVYPDTPTWEGISILTQHGAPVLVVEPQSGKLLGWINSASAFAEIKRLGDG